MGRPKGSKNKPKPIIRLDGSVHLIEADAREDKKERKVIRLQRRLIGLLLAEHDDIIESGFAHGWISKRSPEINIVRNELGELAELVHSAKKESY